MFRGVAALVRRRYGDTFSKGKISEPVPGLDFQRDKVACKRLKKPGKGIRILSPRLVILVENLDFTGFPIFLCLSRN